MNRLQGSACGLPRRSRHVPPAESRLMPDLRSGRLEIAGVAYYLSPLLRWEDIMALQTLRHRLRLIRWHALPVSVKRARVEEALREHVVRWEALVRAAESHRPARRLSLIFTHVPKTGGITLDHIIARNYRINGMLQANSPALMRNPSLVFRHGSFPKVLMGHLTLSHPIYTFMENRTAHITMLRDPVARVLSYYRYVRSGARRALHERIETFSLMAFVNSNATVELENAQTLRIAGSLRGRKRLDKEKADEALARAKEALIERFSLFGITERFGEFLIMCRKVLGWRDLFYERRNVSPHPRDDEPPDPEAIAVIRQRNALDLELYAFACDLFDERCRALHITKRDSEILKRQNARYQEMLARQDAHWGAARADDVNDSDEPASRDGTEPDQPPAESLGAPIEGREG